MIDVTTIGDELFFEISKDLIWGRWILRERFGKEFVQVSRSDHWKEEAALNSFKILGNPINQLVAKNTKFVHLHGMILPFAVREV
jgi:hypothetical protein